MQENYNRARNKGVAEGEVPRIITHYLNRIDGMKVDVEGFEEAVLLPFFENAPDTLLPRLIVIEDNRKEWDTDILAVAATRGYRLAKKTHMNLLLERG